ncbi:MAG: DUF1634 domain-containing protein [candidate division Zixibacteria bacterium]|nr:DUF1634 domain-containing protein [candidate division Zixibacteria bacterium]MCI0595884.1 DUF1634 domain-containing protein [candidate division Zixibacteria bacterium]
MNGAAEKWAQKVLETGLVVSLLAVAIGFILQLAGRGDPKIFLKTGFWTLLATPGLRVFILMLAFFREKEKKFAWASAGVLFVLTVSYFIEKL